MSWLQLRSILQESAAYAAFYRSQPPVACPFDGEPLRTGPANQAGILYCPHGDFEYPRDWDADTMSGM